MFSDEKEDIAVRTEAVWGVSNAIGALSGSEHKALMVENVLPKLLKVLDNKEGCEKDQANLRVG